MDKDILKTAVLLRHRLHRCAELSGQEKQTKAILIDFLRTHTSLELHDMGAWFYAVYKAPLNVRTESAPTRRIAFRADLTRFRSRMTPRSPMLPKTAALRINADTTATAPHFAHLRRKLTAMAAAAIFSFFSNMRRRQAAVLPSAKR